MISYLQQFFAVVVELGDRSFVKRLLPTLRLWGHTKDIFDGPELASHGPSVRHSHARWASGEGTDS